MESEQAVLLTSALTNLRDMLVTSNQHLVNAKVVKLSPYRFGFCSFNLICYKMGDLVISMMQNLYARC